jgi:hypothetical protein
LFLANPQSDDRYTLLTLASLAFCYGLLLAFAPAPLRARVRRLLGKATTRTTHA